MVKYYIKIIVEGDEEEIFFEIVKKEGVSEKIWLDIENANGSGKIADLFLSALREDIYDCVICVYDVDYSANDVKSAYCKIRNQLNSLFGDEEITERVSFCTNPNIMQIFLLAADSLDKVSLLTTSKKTNSSLIHYYWPEIASGKTDSLGRKIKNDYSAKKWQLEIIKYSILNQEYPYSRLLENAKQLSTDYKNQEKPGSNLLDLLLALKNGDINFFNEIKKFLDNI